jgi:hypothetical protein
MHVIAVLKTMFQGLVARTTEKINTCKVLTAKPEGERERPLGKSRCRWEEDFKKSHSENELASSVYG